MQETKRLVQVLPERRIITTIGQNSRGDFNALALKIFCKDLLRDLRALGSFRSMRTSISVSNAEKALGNHVEIEIDEKVIDILGGKGRGVVLAAEEAIFFGAPPCEADLVLGLVL